MIDLIKMDPKEIPWDFVSPLLKAACEYNGGRYSIEDCVKEILSGEKILWIAKDEEMHGIAVTGIMQFPNKKCAIIDICTGKNLEKWGHHISLIEKWAKNNACDQMFLITRPGMQKILEINNYRKTHLFFEKDL